jgi:hypothetical protein
MISALRGAPCPIYTRLFCLLGQSRKRTHVIFELGCDCLPTERPPCDGLYTLFLSDTSHRRLV